MVTSYGYGLKDDLTDAYAEMDFECDLCQHEFQNELVSEGSNTIVCPNCQSEYDVNMELELNISFQGERLTNWKPSKKLVDILT